MSMTDKILVKPTTQSCSKVRYWTMVCGTLGRLFKAEAFFFRDNICFHTDRRQQDLRGRGSAEANGKTPSYNVYNASVTHLIFNDSPPLSLSELRMELMTHVCMQYILHSTIWLIYRLFFKIYFVITFLCFLSFKRYGCHMQDELEQVYCN